MTWLDRTFWPQLVKECLPLLLVAAVIIIALVLLWLTGCALAETEGCWPEQTLVLPPEQPEICDEAVYSMKQNVYGLTRQ